jgi:LysM domain
MFVDERPVRLAPLRLAGATAAMAAGGAALPVLAPDPVGAARSLAAVQHLADTAGADAVVVRVAGLLVWLVWAWGALGLVLTAGSALPGAAGALARGLLRIAVPAAARRAATLALGVGIGLNGTVVAGTVLAGPALAATPVATPTAPGIPDWPTAAPAPPGPGAPAPDPTQPGRGVPAPDPTAAPTQAHLVVRGDCLWRIAEAALDAGGRRAPEAEVATAVRAWWSANTAVIGPDPDLLRPGQVLRAPSAVPPITGGDR